MNGELNYEVASLHQLLQTWRTELSLPPGFQQGVWRRISILEETSSSWSALDVVWRWLDGLRRPALASAYLAVLIAAGAGLGYWKSERYVQQTEHSWRAAYLQSVNPYAALVPK